MELAQLDRANTAVRGNLLKRWFEKADAFMRGEARGGQGFRAATGLNVGNTHIAGTPSCASHIPTATIARM
jgi:hypothetical protein